MDPDQQIRNLRDFLLVYNRMTEICFQRCSSNFNYRSLTMDEERCADSCAGKLIRTNHRLMGTYVQLMPKMVQRRMEEMESKAAEAAKAAGATEGAVEGAAGAGVAALPEGAALAETPPPISTALGGAADSAPLQTPSAPGPWADLPVVPSPAGLEFPVDLVPAASVAVAAPPAPEGKMAAAASVTPAAESVLPSSLTTAVNKAAFTTVPPLESPLIIREPSVGVAAGAPPIAVPIVPGNSVPVTSVPPTFTQAELVMPVEASIAPPAGPQAPAASVVSLVSAPVVTPSVGLAEGARPPSAPALVSPVENLDLPKTPCSPVPSSSEAMSFSPSLAPSTVTKQDSQPPS